MITVFLLLAVAAFICVILSALGKCPDWVWGVLLVVIELLRAVPLGR